MIRNNDVTSLSQHVFRITRALLGVHSLCWKWYYFVVYPIKKKFRCVIYNVYLHSYVNVTSNAIMQLLYYCNSNHSPVPSSKTLRRWNEIHVVFGKMDKKSTKTKL